MRVSEIDKANRRLNILRLGILYAPMKEEDNIKRKKSGLSNIGTCSSRSGGSCSVNTCLRLLINLDSSVTLNIDIALILSHPHQVSPPFRPVRHPTWH